MTSATATARSWAPSFSSNFFYKHGNKKVPQTNGGKPLQSHHKRQSNDDSKHNELQHRSSLPSSPSSGTLLERIGGSAGDEATLSVMDLDQIGGECVSQGDSRSDSPSSTTPRFYTPEPEEVERFLESVIGTSSSAPESSGSVHTCSGNKPALTLETSNLPADHPFGMEDPSSSVLPQITVNSLPSTNPKLDHFSQQSPLQGDAMPPSSVLIQECRKRLAPILLASAQARGTANPLDAEQCLRLLSDDQCRNFFRQAKEMRSQLSSLDSQKTPAHQGRSGSLKRDRVDEVDARPRSTRRRFSSMDTVVSEASRRDSDITLIDTRGGRLPPKAPRAMLQASQATLIRYPSSPKDQTPHEVPRVASPTVEDRPPLTERVHQAIKMFPAPVPTIQPVAQIDVPNVSAGQTTQDQSRHPDQAVSPAHSTSPSSTDFVSHLPTRPGIWFKQLGRRYTEIADIDIEVSDEMFYMSKERQPSRLRMHLRLCSFPVCVMTKNDSTDTLASLQNVVDEAIEHRTLHWPKGGKLVVQVNPESERSKTWLSHSLVSDPLDVTSSVRPGKNTFRFIQLSDLSEFAFVLVASPPPPEEEWRSWDWASLVEHSRTRSFSSTDDRADGLSEFAHLAVTVRS